MYCTHWQINDDDDDDDCKFCTLVGHAGWTISFRISPSGRGHGHVTSLNFEKAIISRKRCKIEMLIQAPLTVSDIRRRYNKEIKYKLALSMSYQIKIRSGVLY